MLALPDFNTRWKAHCLFILPLSAIGAATTLQLGIATTLQWFDVEVFHSIFCAALTATKVQSVAQLTEWY
jgi:hypothetical protein